MECVDTFTKKLLDDDSRTIIIRHPGGPNGGPPDIREKIKQLCYGLSQIKYDDGDATRRCLILSSSPDRATKLLEFLCQDSSVFKRVNKCEYRLPWKDKNGHTTLEALPVRRNGGEIRGNGAGVVIIEDANDLPKGSFHEVYNFVRLGSIESTVICLGNARPYGKTRKGFEETCRDSKLVYGNPPDQLHGGDSGVQYYLNIGNYPIIGYENLES